MENKKHHFRATDAFECMTWLAKAYPKIFKEWVCVHEVAQDNDEEIMEREV